MRYYLLIVGLLLSFSCNEPEHPLLYDDEKAIDLLIDLSIANIALNKYPLSYRDSMGDVFKSQIATIHDLEVQELDTLLWMMQNDYDRYNKLYKDLHDTLQNLESNLGNVREDKPFLEYKQKYDSIKTGKQ